MLAYFTFKLGWLKMGDKVNMEPQTNAHLSAPEFPKETRG